MSKKQYNILIVDDEKEVLNALYMTIFRNTKFKATIHKADNCDIAFQLLDEHQYDLVISDYKMPGINGIEFLTQVMDKFPNQLRVLITGYTDINVAKEAIRLAQIHCYIEKPWDNQQLVQTIYDALTRKKIANILD